MEAELGSVPHELPGDAGPAAGTAAATAPKKSKAKVIKKDTMHNVNPDLKFSNMMAPIPLLNGKNVAGNFARSDAQSWWARRKNDEDWDRDRAEKRRRLRHGGDEPSTMNIDRATPDETEWDGNPASRTIVIHPGSRWLRIGCASNDEPVSIPNVIARRTTTLLAPARSYPVLPAELDPSLEPKVEALRGDLRNRFRAYKLRPQSDGTAQAKIYNGTAPVDTVEESADLERAAWTRTAGAPPKATFVGEGALRIREPDAEGWTLRWPMDRGNFNTRGYASVEELLGDIAEIWLFALEERLGIKADNLKDYSVVYIIPDLYNQTYLREITNLLLEGLGFRQVCFQQESMCTTMGTGLSTACVVDLGARKTSIACVEEGMILPDTRTSLDIGGDDITELLYQVLLRINFPYKEANLNRTYDWVLFEYLKESVCVLSEGDVALNLYHFDVRRPGKPLLKSSVQLFDEIILAPLCLFAPRIIDFDRKHTPMPSLWPAADDVDEVIDLGGDAVTTTMRICTRHLLPSLIPPPLQGGPDANVLPNGDDGAAAMQPSATAVIPASAPGATIDPAAPMMSSAFDVPLEASKVPLDVAVFESLCTVVGEDRLKRLVNSIVLIGGTAKIHNAGFALQSRLAILFSTRYPALTSQINVVPPPLNLDHRIIVWKGAALLAKLDSASDLWIRGHDWETLGIRAIKERTLCCL